MKCLGIFAITVWFAAVVVSAEVAVNIKEETMDLLEKSMSRYHKKLIEEMPDKIRLYLSSYDNPKSVYELKDADSVRWINDHVRVGADEDLMKRIGELRSDLAMSGDKLHGDDIATIFESSFFATWNKENFNLKEFIIKSAISWREKSEPIQRLSPDGLNPIDWRWQLSVESREGGILHVGIDEKKKTFICYEYTVGLYFPEGQTLERIYREIVQDPDMAGQFFGKERKQKTNPFTPNNNHTLPDK